MKRIFLLTLAVLFAFSLSACGIEAPPEETTAATTEPIESTVIFCGADVLMWDDFDYSTLSLPDYKAENPVRYLSTDASGFPCDGWQDFGLSGEICTVTVPQQMSYTYQMYSWFVRNGIESLYPGQVLPTDPAELADWLGEFWLDVRNGIWYSMLGEKPASAWLDSADILTTDSGIEICRAKYTLTLNGGESQDWLLYLMCEDGSASALGIRINENAETVTALADAIIGSYKAKN